MSLPGRLVYRLWHQPKSWLIDLWLEGGPWERSRTHQGREAMRAAARHLPLPPCRVGQPLSVTLLSGARYWDMTAFCLISLAQACERPIAPILIDDGSLPNEAVASLQRLFPSLIIHGPSSVEERLNHCLPADRFPVLRAHRLVFPLLRKITDVYCGLSGWQLFLDSDLLFFHRPDELLAWAENPLRPLHGRDLQNAYGYPLSVLAGIAGQPVPERVNTGTLGLNGDAIDWPLLERACATLLTEHGPHYYMEQALVAILLAGQNCAVPPPTRYVLLPQPPEALACTAVMHHYVAESKRWYFQRNWRRFA